MWLEHTIVYKKAALSDLLGTPMEQLANRCSAIWPDPDQLDEILGVGISQVPNCHLLYALDTEGVQISSNISPAAVEKERRGQNLASRPYLTSNLPYKGFLLSPVYVSEVSMKPCITAIQAVTADSSLVGFLAADFNLHDLPLPEISPSAEPRWTQYKGDPAIRQTVFMQKRVNSVMDCNIDQVIDTVGTLMCDHGVYHCILHFSSSRAIFWLYEDPYSYRLHSVEELRNPEIWLAYPGRPYPAQAIVTCDQLRRALKYFKALRVADENIYLRSASINVMNGLVGLTFSCDGSHYMQVNEFLSKELSFWV